LLTKKNKKKTFTSFIKSGFSKGQNLRFYFYHDCPCTYVHIFDF
jgi:hypothetical protein